jgi:hypothetical protein
MLERGVTGDVATVAAMVNTNPRLLRAGPGPLFDNRLTAADHRLILMISNFRPEVVII